MASFFEWLSNFWKNLQDLLLWVPMRIWELLLESLAWVITAIPVPSWASNTAGLFSGLPTGVSWGFYLFNVPTGIGIIMSAYLIRFLIRRIPLIG